MLPARTTRLAYPTLSWREIALLLLASLSIGFSAKAQITPPLATPRTTTSPTGSEPPKPKQLSPQKMEEALRLLLRADSVASVHQRARLGPESSGLVVDQTITKIGHDFYDQFYSRFEAPVQNEDFTIVISEKPSRGNNAIVTLTVNNEELLELPLQARLETIEEAATYAAEIAGGFLQQARNLSQQLERGNKQALETY